MWKQIEAYIRDNREALDIERPSDDLWDRINRELHEEAPRQLWSRANLMRIAAAIALLAAMSYFWYLRLGDNVPKGAIANIGNQANQQDEEPMANTPQSWDEVTSPHQAPIDSMMALPQAAEAPTRRIDQSIDSLMGAGAPTQERVELYQQMMARKAELLTQATH